MQRAKDAPPNVLNIEESPEELEVVRSSQGTEAWKRLDIATMKGSEETPPEVTSEGLLKFMMAVSRLAKVNFSVHSQIGQNNALRMWIKFDHSKERKV